MESITEPLLITKIIKNNVKWKAELKVIENINCVVKFKRKEVAMSNNSGIDHCLYFKILNFYKRSDVCLKMEYIKCITENKMFLFLNKHFKKVF